MKKSLIALAVAGAMTAPLVAQADATLYGVAEFRVIDEDTMDLNGAVDKTRLGVKGTVDNDIEGLTTGYQFEWDMGEDNDGTGSNLSSTADADVAIRKSLVYMKGGFGQVTFGRQNSPANVADAGIGINGDTFSVVADRMSNGIAYYTPNMNGVTAGVGIVIDGSSSLDSEDDDDAYSIGLDYAANGLSVALGYVDIADDLNNTGNDITSLRAGYSMNDMSVIAGYQIRDFDATSASDTESFLVGASYSLGMTTVSLAYTDIDVDAGDTDDNDMWLINATYKLGAQASVAVEYNDFDKDTGANGANDKLILSYALSF